MKCAAVNMDEFESIESSPNLHPESVGAYMRNTLLRYFAFAMTTVSPVCYYLIV